MVRRFIWILVFCVVLPAAGETRTWDEEWYRDLREATKTGTCNDLLRHLERGKQSERYRLGLVVAANALEKGRCGSKDVARAITLYREAVRLGSISAKVKLGRIYFLGAGVPRDSATAKYWYRGAVLALFTIPDELRLDMVTDEWTADSANERITEELEWMRRLAASAPRKRMEIARKLLNGDGVPPDPEVARSWIASAADDGSPAAMLAYALWMIDGRVEEFSKGNGVKLLRKTAERDHVPAMTELARRLEFGDGMERDQASAYAWLLRAGWRGAATGDALQRVGGRLSAKEKASTAEICAGALLVGSGNMLTIYGHNQRHRIFSVPRDTRSALLLEPRDCSAIFEGLPPLLWFFLYFGLLVQEV